MHREQKNTRWATLMRGLLVGVPLMLPISIKAADNLDFKGVLVTEACSLRPGDEALELELAEVSTHNLYLNTRSPGNNFKIHLEGCDISIADTVTTTFSGNESLALPGLLALDAGSEATGVAIGLETREGTPLLLNSVSEEQFLRDGSNLIEFSVYVKGEPGALADRSITAGRYGAVSTFTLNYP